MSPQRSMFARVCECRCGSKTSDRSWRSDDLSAPLSIRQVLQTSMFSKRAIIHLGDRGVRKCCDPFAIVFRYITLGSKTPRPCRRTNVQLDWQEGLVGVHPVHIMSHDTHIGPLKASMRIVSYNYSRDQFLPSPSKLSKHFHLVLAELGLCRDLVEFISGLMTTDGRPPSRKKACQLYGVWTV